MNQEKDFEVGGGTIEIDLLELFYALLDRAKLIISAALIGALAMAFYSFVLAKPMYQATSKLYVLNQQDSAVNLSDLQIGAYLTSDYQEVFDTWEVQQMVIDNLKLDYTYKELRDMVDIENPSNTRMLYITVTSADPKEAAAIANEYAVVAKGYISDTMETDEPSLMSQALEPTVPVSPRKLRNVVLGFVGGGMLAALLIAVIYMLDDKIKTAEDIRQYSGLPTLAVVPTNTGKGMVKRSTGGQGSRSVKKRGKK